MPHAALEDVKARLATAAEAAGREGGDLTLVAVSKTFGAEDIAPVIAAGQLVFGENRVQEAHGKWPELKARNPGAELHLIGPLQTNKADDAVALFDWIETVDREKLAKALSKAGDKAGRMPRLMVQVNTGAEPQKAGVLPEDADGFIANCRAGFGLEIEGLMCIPPLDEEAAPHFLLLEKIARRNGLAFLSMGMSADFEKAVHYGATHVRVGSAIFDARDKG